MATNITYYLIRHKPTGGYLPQPWGFMGRGGSHVEPVVHDINDIKTQPRTFHTKRAAANALSQWMRGKAYNDGEGGYDGPYVVPTRIFADMEIIPVELIIP